MEEKTPSKLFRSLQILIPLTGVAVGIAGVLLTVAARKKELTCTLINSTRLVSENLGGIHPDLHVEFHGQAIFSLTKMTFELRNTGAAAIMAKDVVEPVRLLFPTTTKLMGANVERTSPADLAFSAAPDRGVVELDFPLLNRGDEATFSVYVFNSEAQRPILEGRIVDVPQLIYSEASISAEKQSMWPFQSHATRSVVRLVLVTIYGALTMIFVGIWFGGVASFVKFLPWKKKWKRLYDDAMNDVAQVRHQERNATAHGKAEGPDMEALRGIEGRARMEGMVMIGEYVSHYDPKLQEELKKRNIPKHPQPMVGSIGGLATLSGAMFTLALVCSTTALVVFRAFGG